VIPAIHYIITDGFWKAINFAALGWLVLMAVLYIVGALIYACRIPERIFPGKCDIWVGVRFLYY
jgi:adiponectin receptor